MSLFDQLVDEALRNRSELAVLRPVVEKELLHHDILREMSAAKLLAPLTFIGGTCLRACYGSERLSEDLDFTGGAEFQKEDLRGLARVLVERLEIRYALPVKVGEPVKSSGNVDTWKLSIETRPGQRHLPAQRIRLDICAIPSHDPQPMMLRNLYGIDMGTSGLILQAQSRDEILADKIVAFAFRKNRIKNRDLWDIDWLVREGVRLPVDLIPLKLVDHKRTGGEFVAAISERLDLLANDPETREDFLKEMRRFLPVATIRETVERPDYWTYLATVVGDQCRRAVREIS